MVQAEECNMKVPCHKCKDYSKAKDGLEICKKYLAVIFAGEGDAARKEFQKLASEITDIQTKNQTFLHNLLQKKMNGEQLTEVEMTCHNLLCQYHSLELDLRPWAKDGCVPAQEDGKHMYQLIELVKQIKAYFEEEQYV